MKRYYKPTGIFAAAAMTAAVFATSDRLPAQSTTDSQPSAKTSAEEGPYEVTVAPAAAPAAESQARKPNAFKTLDDVRKSYKRGRAAEGSDAGDLRPGVAGMMEMMGGGMPGGDMLGGDMPSGTGMMSMPPSGPREQAMNKINGLRKKLKAASKEDQPKFAEQLRAALAEYFLIDMQLRVKELDEIKARVERMEAKLQKRLDSREEAVDLQLKLFLRDAEGLGFFRSEDSPAK